MSLMMWRYMQHHGAGAPDAYAVGGFEPEFVADFSGTLNSGTEYYRSGGSDTTFSSVFTHSGLVLPATMTDSDGVLKWAPHNLLPFSNDFDNATYSAFQIAFTEGQTNELTGNNDATLFTATGSTGSVSWSENLSVLTSTSYSLAVFAKAGTASWLRIGTSGLTTPSDGGVYFNLSTGVKGTENAGFSGTIESKGDGWYLCTATFTTDATDSFGGINLNIAEADNDISWAAISGQTMLFYGVHFYRSGLGGMVNNPDTSSTYVATTGAAKFLPRRNNYIYNGTSWENAGILIEPAAATNLATYSNDFTNAAWTNQGSTDAASSVNGPDGNLATTLTATNTNLRHIIQQGPITVVAGAVTVSAYLKYNNNQWVSVGTYEGSYIGANFDLINNVPGSATAGVTARMENIGGGWYRCSITYTHTTTAAYAVVHLMDSDRTNFTSSWSAAGTEKVEIFGVQLEQGSVPTSYIPTTTTVTRAAETLTVAGSSLPANTTGVSVQMQGRMTYADLGTEAQRTFWRWYNGAGDFLLCDLDTDGADTGEVNANQSDTTGGAGTVAIDAYSPGINVAYNIASRHSNTDINLAVDGTAGTADTTPTALHDASSDTFQVAHNLQGSVGMLRVWGTGLSDTDLESAT